MLAGLFDNARHRGVRRQQSNIRRSGVVGVDWLSKRVAVVNGPLGWLAVHGWRGEREGERCGETSIWRYELQARGEASKREEKEEKKDRWCIREADLGVRVE
jgi:hypothetical protein